jgi:hypothetical protein
MIDKKTGHIILINHYRMVNKVIEDHVKIIPITRNPRIFMEGIAKLRYVNKNINYKMGNYSIRQHYNIFYMISIIPTNKKRILKECTKTRKTLECVNKLTGTNEILAKQNKISKKLYYILKKYGGTNDRKKRALLLINKKARKYIFGTVDKEMGNVQRKKNRGSKSKRIKIKNGVITEIIRNNGTKKRNNTRQEIENVIQLQEARYKDKKGTYRLCRKQ